ncbi:hypothetical protein [Faecalibacter macacae]|uniref:Uncharacterized protein n=1 Tax=Faecalibacter macacae TaxID=1859289 RepID=A0A3L9MF33_9FLAO|nr:hypothetical protein [Faecalibacter macacae]RLZ11508.1 hypothetical protein EAH69_05565 [Faecalibacter macacae]
MKKKKTFSRFDYYLMLLDEFKDQFTIVLLFNIAVFFLSNNLDSLYSQTYLYSSFNDYFDEFSVQFILNDFFKILGYIYFFAIFVHFGVYKKNIKWLFRLNAAILVLASTYVWCIPTFNSILLILEKGHLFFILSLFTQFLTYLVVGNEFYQLIKKRIKQPEINHS